MIRYNSKQNIVTKLKKKRMDKYLEMLQNMETIP